MCSRGAGRHTHVSIGRKLWLLCHVVKVEESGVLELVEESSSQFAQEVKFTNLAAGGIVALK